MSYRLFNAYSAVFNNIRRNITIWTLVTINLHPICKLEGPYTLTNC